MQALDVTQGSPEWLGERHASHCASEAPAMMGVSAHVKRNELLHAKKTLSQKEFSEWEQRHLLDKGHAAEEAARPHVEVVIGEDLYRVTGVREVDGMRMLASFDGLTMSEDAGWEHKLWNADLVRAVESSPDDGAELSPMYWAQLEHQLLVSGAEKMLFTVSDGTPEKMRHCWYVSRPERRQAIIAGWRQFDEDLAAYVPVAAEPTKTAAPVKELPAIIWKRDGTALTHNLHVFREAAAQLVEDSKKPLETDQDFADREALCKSFKTAEDKIEVYKAQVLGEIKDVDEFSRDLTEIRDLIRQARLNGEKQVAARKETIRIEILEKAKAAIAAHTTKLNERLGRPYMPPIHADFAAAMKNKRTVVSLRDAVDTVLARAKIEANEHADRIQINLNKLREMAEDYKFLFNDAATIVLKPTEDLVTLINYRLGEHKRKEEARIEAEREKIRAEEAAKAKAEAEVKLRAEAEAKAKEDAEKARKEAEERAAAEAAEKAKREAEEKARLAEEERQRKAKAELETTPAVPPAPAAAVATPEPERPGPAAPAAAAPVPAPAIAAVAAVPLASDQLRELIGETLIDFTHAELQDAYAAVRLIRTSRRKTA